MTKRQKFVLSSVFLALGFLVMQFVEEAFRYHAIVGLVLSCFVFSFLSLKDGLGRNATLLTLVLPTFFTAAVGLFYFLLPANIIARLPVVFLYGLGIYALFLTANIYTVAAARTIALLRAAHAVGFILTLVTTFLLFDTVLSYRFDFWVNGILASLVSFPLLASGLWSVDLEPVVSKEVLLPSVALAVSAGEVAAVLSFWPVTVTVFSVALTTVLYVGLGLGQANIQQRLFKKTVREYLLVGLVVFVTMFITARWGG